MEEALWTTHNLLAMAHYQEKIQETLHETEREDESWLFQNLETQLLQTPIIYQIPEAKTNISPSMSETEGTQTNSLFVAMEGTFW